jgi:hypothetical protein
MPGATGTDVAPGRLDVGATEAACAAPAASAISLASVVLFFGSFLGLAALAMSVR